MENKVYNGYKIALSENELDDILNNKVTKFVFNSVDEYNALDLGDKEALKHLVKAAQALTTVFLKQDHHKNIEMKQALESASEAGDTYAQKVLEIFNVFQGLEGNNGLSADPVIIFEGLNASPNKNVFPPDLKKEELIEYCKKQIEEGNIELVKGIFSYDAIVKRDEAKLISVPYTVEFAEEYEKAANELLLASKQTTHKGFKEFLEFQAKSLLSKDPKEAEYNEYLADKIWANLKDCPLEFTIGRENYDDFMTGSVLEDKNFAELLAKNSIEVKPKDFIGARVGIVDLKATKELEDYKNHLENLAKLMPLTEKYPKIENKNKSEEGKQTLADVDIVYLSGDYAACRPGITLAQNLPNDDKMASKLNCGNRNVFHKQIRRTENPERRQRFLDSLVELSQHKW